jgi:hypothetical protein
VNACCRFCRKPVDPLDKSTWRAVTGWERKAFGESRRGGSDIVLRELGDEYACPRCIVRQQQGLSVAQEQLC